MLAEQQELANCGHSVLSDNYPGRSANYPGRFFDSVPGVTFLIERVRYAGKENQRTSG